MSSILAGRNAYENAVFIGKNGHLLAKLCSRVPDSRLETLRLYFVDTTESRSRGKRSDEQAAYFGVTRAQAIDLGLVSNGLARIYGDASTAAGRSRDSREYLARLHALENEAKAAKRGGWGNGAAVNP